MAGPENADGVVPMNPEVGMIPIDLGEIDNNATRERLSFLGKLSLIAHSSVEDYRQSPNKLRTLASGVGALGTQVLDRLRVAVVIVPPIATDILKHTRNPLEAAVVGGGIFAAWCWGVGGTLTEGMAEYPRTVSSTAESFPKIVKFVEASLPGMRTSRDSEKGEDPKKKSIARRIGGTALMRLGRGFSAISLGNTPFVGVASLRGMSRKSVHKISGNTGLDGGIAVGLIIGGAGESIIRLSHRHPELALHIQNVASNVDTWYCVAATLMLGNFAVSQIIQRKEQTASPDQIEINGED